MTADQILAELQKLGSDKVREMNSRHGLGENQFGVKMGDIRALAKTIKTDHAVALQLWATGNLEAMHLATLIVKPAQLSAEELEGMVRTVLYKPELPLSQLSDWLNSNVVKLHPRKEDLRERWMAAEDPPLARAGWSLTAEAVAKKPGSLNLPSLLERIEREMPTAPAYVQWTINFTLAEIGIRHAEFRERATAIGENLGVFRDFPVSKGCTSPFAPIWIEAIAAR